MDTIPISKELDEVSFVSPSLSASIGKKAQIELSMFSIFSTQKSKFTRITQSNEEISFSRSSNIDQVFQLQYGLSNNNRVSIGFDFYVSRIRSDSIIENSFWRILSDDKLNVQGISTLGPRIRWIPFKKIPELTFQHSLLFPSPNPARQIVFSRSTLQLQNQISFYQYLHPRVIINFQGDFSVAFKNKNFFRDTFGFSVNPFLSFNVLGQRSNVYPKIYLLGNIFYTSNYARKGIRKTLNRINYAFGLGGGALLSLNSYLSMILFYQNPINYNSGINGLEILPNSWHTFNFGFRVNSWKKKRVAKH